MSAEVLSPGVFEIMTGASHRLLRIYSKQRPKEDMNSTELQFFGLHSGTVTKSIIIIHIKMPTEPPIHRSRDPNSYAC